MKYEIYHDENKVDGYNHGILFVPLEKKQRLVELLKAIRDEHQYPYNSDLKYAGVQRQKRKQFIINNQLTLFNHAIKTRCNEPTKFFKRTGLDVARGILEPFLELTELLGCKFGFLKVRDNHESLSYFDSYAKKVETTFRFVLKGCCHGMFNSESPIEITKFYFDGDEHHDGNIDLNRIIRGDFRNYVSISEDIDLCSQHIDQRDLNSKIITSFVDNIVGAWSDVVNNGASQSIFLYPLSEIHERARERKIFTNPHGRWYKSISLSEFKLKNGETEFLDLFRSPSQKTLF